MSDRCAGCVSLTQYSEAFVRKVPYDLIIPSVDMAPSRRLANYTTSALLPLVPETDNPIRLDLPVLGD